MVEHGTENAGVDSSSLSLGTTSHQLSAWHSGIRIGHLQSRGLIGDITASACVSPPPYPSQTLTSRSVLRHWSDLVGTTIAPYIRERKDI